MLMSIMMVTGQHKSLKATLWPLLLCYAESGYAVTVLCDIMQCHYTEIHYAVCHSTKYRYTEFHYADFNYALC
jgi:hypothetical protein